MRIVTNKNDWLAIKNELKTQTIGFVPTMGNLHAGHMSLVKQAKEQNNIVVVSIFVNPTQFNDSKDFANYPKTIEADIALLKINNVDYLFLPTEDVLYPDGYTIQLHETVDSKTLEGEFRPGHFSGMLTIVAKLLNLIGAHHAYFGEKDFQQLELIKKMVLALFIPTKIIAGKTVRAEDGLALSSRNSRLTEEARSKANLFFSLLSSSLNCEEIKKQLSTLGFQVEYIEEKWQRRLGAVWLNGVRLIDNVSLIENEKRS